MCICGQKAIISIYNINFFFFIIIAEARCTSRAVGTGSSNQTDTVSSLKWLMYQGFTYMYFTDWMRYILYDNWLKVIRSKLQQKKNFKRQQSALFAASALFRHTYKCF